MSKTIDLEYVGDPPILDDTAKMRIARGDITKEGAAILRSADMCRLKAIPGLTRRIVDVESFHTSREYVFGPDVFVVAVTHADAHKILDSESGQQFRRCDAPDIIIPSLSEIAFTDRYITDEHEISPYDVSQRKN